MNSCPSGRRPSCLRLRLSLCSMQLQWMPCQSMRQCHESWRRRQKPVSFFHLGVRMHPAAAGLRLPLLLSPCLTSISMDGRTGSPPVHVMTLHVSPAPRPAMAACCSHVTVTPGWDASRMHAASDTHGALSLSLLFMAVVVVSIRLKRRLHAGFCGDEIGRGTRMRVRDKKKVFRRRGLGTVMMVFVS